MKQRFNWPFQQRRGCGAIQSLLIALLFLGMTVPAHAQQEDIRNLHPAILTLAEENPNETLRVIVQQNAREGLGREAIGRSGGTVLETLPIINGIVMEMPARAVVELAQSRGVRWITLDAPVAPSALPGSTCNMLTNAGFENGFTNWDNWDGTLQRQLSGQAHTGAFAAQLGSATGTLSQDLSSIKAGVTYHAKGMFRRPTGAANAWMSFGITFMNSNWNELSSVEVEIPESATYSPLTASGVAPANTRYMSIWVWKANGGQLYVDDLSIENSTMSASACANYTATGGYNVLENADFEAGLTNWYNSGTATVTTTSYMGAKAIYLGSSSGTIAQAESTAYAGVTYTARGMFRRPAGSPWTGIGIDFFDANWNEIDEAYTAIPESSNYIPVAVSGVAPAGTAHMSLWIYKNSGGELYIDNVSLVGGDVPDAYVQSTGADLVWHAPKPRNGQGVTVAVVDSGIADHDDLDNPSTNQSRVVESVDFTNSGNHGNDIYGHGTHVAGIIGGNGTHSFGIHKGIAPGVNLVNVRISNGQGMTYSSDLIAGLQWLFENKDLYNIRVVNLSLNSTIPESYHTSPISAAVELLWFRGMTVVVSAGNNGTANGPSTIYAPANDPFVITVGAVDDRQTGSLTDDVVESFSAYGNTIEGHAKPDLVASGRNIFSLAAGGNSTMGNGHPAHAMGNYYFRMSGTSMAAPVVSGVVALLLQDEPNLTPDQIKYRLMATASTNWPGYNSTKAGAGYVNAYAALYGTSTASANTGIPVSQMLFTGDDPVAWDSVSWNSVSWNSVSWNSVSWNSVSWNSVSWNSVSWASSIWDDWMFQEYSTDEAPASIIIDLPAVDEGKQAALGHRLYVPMVTR